MCRASLPGRRGHSGKTYVRRISHSRSPSIGLAAATSFRVFLPMLVTTLLPSGHLLGENFAWRHGAGAPCSAWRW
jgi:hypothetical protein